MHSLILTVEALSSISLSLYQPQLPSFQHFTQLPPSPHNRRHAYLLAKVLDDGLVLAVVSQVGPPFLQSLHDLHLQLLVGLLQVPHRLQVVGQAVVQVLHCSPLVAHDLITSSSTTSTSSRCSRTGTTTKAGAHTTTQRISQVEARRRGHRGARAQVRRGDRGNASVLSTGTGMNAGSTEVGPGAGEGDVGTRVAHFGED